MGPRDKWGPLEDEFPELFDGSLESQEFMASLAEEKGSPEMARLIRSGIEEQRAEQALVEQEKQ